MNYLGSLGADQRQHGEKIGQVGLLECRVSDDKVHHSGASGKKQNTVHKLVVVCATDDHWPLEREVLHVYSVYPAVENVAAQSCQ